MRQAIEIIKKNFKIIFNNKLTFFLIFLGPFLIIFLLGFFYYNDNSLNINVGVYKPDNSNLTNEFILALSKNNIKIQKYNSKDACKQGIKSAITHLCIFFPKNFSLEKKNNIDILLDSTRPNIRTISENIIIKILNDKKKELQLGLTDKIVKTLKENKNKFLLEKELLDNISNENQNLKKKLELLNLTLKKFNTISKFEDFGNKKLNKTIEEVKLDKKKFLNNTDNQISSIREYLNDLESNINSLSINSSEKNNLTNYISKIKTNLTSIDVELGKLENLNSIKNLDSDLIQIENSLKNLDNNLNILEKKIRKYNSRAYLENLKIQKNINESIIINNQVIQKIDNIKIKDSNKIVKGIKFNTNNIVSKSSNNLNAIFPSLIAGLITIISLLLSSNLIFSERKSKANFRNFMVKTSGFSFLLGNFLTLFLIIFSQIGIIILVYYFMFLKILNLQILYLLMLLIPIIILFVLLGMVLGNITENSSSNLILIFIIIFLLFSLSGSILPLEIISSKLISFSFLNPYLVSLSILRKFLLFNTNFIDLKFEFIIIGIYGLIFFIFAYILEEIKRKRELYQIFILAFLKIKNKLSKNKKNKK